jgi:hypothetical protein
MKKASLTIVVLVLLAALATSPAWAGGPQCANGSHFSYGPLTPYAQWTFTGTGGSVITNFDVKAPNEDNGFPVGTPPRDCAPTATATIDATEVTKVADANGNPIDPVSEDGTSLGDAISAAFAFVPNPWANFSPGDGTTIVVTLSNPNVDPLNYGDYDVKLAAHDNGAGIGVGDGPHFTLKLRAQPCTNTIPDVTITKLIGDPPGVLGTVPLTFTARDICDDIESMTATVTSSGGAVNQSISVSISPGLPVPALATGTATGSFTPYGGTGSPGTADALAFTDVSGNRSGIGNYSITAQATDQSNVTGSDTWTFDVNYAVTFTKQSVPSGCSSAHTGACHADFQFTVTRSGISSDGAFMYDHTVVVVLVRNSDNAVVATHPYCNTAVTTCTQIDSTVPTYLTVFGHPGGIVQAYHAEVWFINVDGTLTKQATSISLSF